MQRDGKVVLHPDTGALFKPYVRDDLMDKMTSAEGQLYDEKMVSGITIIRSPIQTGLSSTALITPRWSI